MVIKGESQFSVLPLPLSFARSRKSKGCPNSGFGRGVGLRGRGRYPLKPIIFASLLETKGYPEHNAARSSREYFRLKIIYLKLQQSCPVTYIHIYICNHALNWNVLKNQKSVTKWHLISYHPFQRLKPYVLLSSSHKDSVCFQKSWNATGFVCNAFILLFYYRFLK